MNKQTLRPDTSKFHSMDEFVRAADAGGFDKIMAVGPAPELPQVTEKPAPFNLQMPPALRKRIKIISAQCGIHMNDLIVTALNEKYPE